MRKEANELREKMVHVKEDLEALLKTDRIYNCQLKFLYDDAVDLVNKISAFVK